MIHWTQNAILRRLGPAYWPGGPREGEAPEPSDIAELETWAAPARIRKGGWDLDPELHRQIQARLR